MASLDGLLVRKMSARGKVKQVGSDQPVALRIRNKAGLAVTSVTVTTGTGIVLIDSAGTTTLAFATYTTVGLLADKINGTTSWECKVLDTLRADLTTGSTMVDGAITASVQDGTTVWDMLVDTSVLKQFAVCVRVDRAFNFNESTVKGHQVKLKSASYYITLGGAAANLFKIYERDGSTETVIFSALSVSATVTTPINNIGDPDAFLSSDKELIIVVSDATSITDATLNYLRAVYIIE